MAIKPILYVAGFVIACGGALFVPLAGVLGYMGQYPIGGQWYTMPVRQLGVRVSFLLALFTGVGIVLRYRDLRCGKKLLTGVEWLMLVFLGVIWLSVLLGQPTEGGRYTIMDHPSVKMAKIVLFVLMLTHVATTAKRFNLIMWYFVLSGLFLGYRAFTTPLSHFTRGRLENIGGPDFRDANALAMYLACMLPFIAVQFLQSRWVGKLVCLVAGAFTANGIILTRSRGALVGIAAGAVVALVLAPKKRRLVIIGGLVLAVAGGLYLTDARYLDRMSTIHAEGGEMDASSRSRLEIWRGSVAMLEANPLGVGVGNFEQSIGRYAREFPGRDAHNTFIRCYGEMGFPGLFALAFLIISIVVSLRRLRKRIGHLPQAPRETMRYAAYAVSISVAIVLVCGMTISLLYIEAMWWFLALPVCLSRVAENLQDDLAAETGSKKASRKRSGKEDPPRPGAKPRRRGDLVKTAGGLRARDGA